jgi:probable HAF family extracellular repeat protein
MPITSAKHLPFLATILALGWGCASDSPGPSDDPEVSQSTATASVATYRVRSLGTLGGNFSQAFGINDANMVVGASNIVGSTETHAFVWKNGVMTDLGTLTGGRQSEARAINGEGVIVGWSLNQAGFMRAVRWMNGNKRNLGTLGGRNSQALAISPLGAIVGWSETASGHRHAFRWENGVMTDLGTLPGGNSSIARDINRGGAIVGSSNTASGETHAFRWKDGVFTDLGTQGRQFSRATAINSAGQIAGILGPTEDAAGAELDFTEGFVFYRDLWTRILGILHSTKWVEDISPSGIVVGWSEEIRSEDPDDAEAPWVWENGTTAELPRLAPGDSHAHGVNRVGNIVGSSANANGRTRAVLWTRIGG